MLRNYLTIALRTLRRNTAYAFITVSGLALGLGCCLLIALYVVHERSFDRFHTQADRIVRVYDDVRLPTGTTHAFNVSAYVGPGLAEAFPEVTTYARLAQPRSSFVFGYGDRYREETALLYADSSLFEIFDFPLLQGDPATALAAPYSIVLTESAARAYVGDADPLGTVLTRADDGQAYTVTGVAADVPARSHLQFDGLISMTTAEVTQTFAFQDLLDLRFATYLLLREGTSPVALSAKFPELVERLLGDVQEQNNFTNTFGLVPLAEVYLHDAHRGLGLRGSRSSLTIFSAIALFTLLIACINFMNLATARSAERAREVGVRKVIGAQRLQLAGQFLGESTLLALTALLLGLALAGLSLPTFTRLTGQALTLDPLATPAGIGLLLASVLGIGLLAGAYPALVLSGFRPITVLKGRFLASRRGTALRKGLVVFQFSLSVALIVGALVVRQQLRHMQRQHLGFRTERMLVLDFQGDDQVRDRIDVVTQELERQPGVAGVTASQAIPSRLGYTALARVRYADGSTQETMMPVFPVDFDFFDVYGLDFVAGRSFSSAFASDSTEAFIINETAARTFGYASPEDALDMPVFEWGQQGRVVGVVRDFHYASLRTAIEPMNFLISPGLARFLTLRLVSDDLPGTIAAVEQAWQRLAPHRPFTYRFLDESFDAQYRAEMKFGAIVGSFAVLAILVACLGLFGLAAFTAQQRVKEIGIRKVLGASVVQIVRLLGREVVVLVVVATLLAAPVAYVVMNRWLDAFAYRIDMSAWTFLHAGLAALVVTLLTVGYQTVRAARADPVKSLRYE